MTIQHFNIIVLCVIVDYVILFINSKDNVINLLYTVKAVKVGVKQVIIKN